MGTYVGDGVDAGGGEARRVHAAHGTHEGTRPDVPALGPALLPKDH